MGIHRGGEGVAGGKGGGDYYEANDGEIKWQGITREASCERIYKGDEWW